jgi:hypothetical protein
VNTQPDFGKQERATVLIYHVAMDVQPGDVRYLRLWGPCQIEPSSRRSINFMPESIFDDIERVNVDARKRSESQFECLNRSADPNVAWMRQTLENWYAMYPGAGRPEIRTRSRFGGDRGFDSAFHELLLNALMCSIGCTCEVHPDLANGGKHPDFLVSDPSGPDFFLEARIVKPLSEAQAGEQRREGDLLDRVDQIGSSKYALQVSVLRAASAPGSPKKLHRAVQEWMALLDFDAVAKWWKSDDDGGDEPRFVYEEPSGWAIEFVALPRVGQAQENASKRGIAIEIGEAAEIDTFTPLKNALIEKAKHYGNLDRPYIIAVNAMDTFMNEDSFEEVLFGRKAANLVRTPEGLTARCGRQADGLWFPSAPEWALRVSGVLFTRKLSAGCRLPDSQARLYLNPWAKHQYVGALMRLPTARLMGAEYCKQTGEPINDLIPLPPRP